MSYIHKRPKSLTKRGDSIMKGCDQLSDDVMLLSSIVNEWCHTRCLVDEVVKLAGLMACSAQNQAGLHKRFSSLC